MNRLIGLFLMLSLALLVIMGCSNKGGAAEGETDEQIAARYVETLGYRIVDPAGEVAQYTLDQTMLENLDYMQLWSVQKQEPDAYFGKKIITYRFLVENHPLEQQYPPDEYRIAVNVMLADHEVIGGTSGPLSIIKNLIVAGGEYSIEGKTLKEIKGLDYSQWLEHWKESYGTEVK